MANDPLKDISLEDAQKEIHRRLLREEKLKRIEEEEMRRLSAMGWQPPRGGPAAHRGTSVQDAADAIETMEEEKRALTEQALRRARQRLNNPKVSADEIMKVPPILPRRGPPTPEERARAPLLKLQRILKQFNAIEKVFRDDGQIRAADMWRRYLNGTGEPVTFAPAEMRAYDVVKDAEEALNQYFVDWMIAPQWEKRTVRGLQTQPVKSDLERLSPELLAMKDGQTKFAHSDWDRRLRYPSYWSMRSGGESEDARDLYGFLGEAQLSGDGGFKFTRHGDTIEFDGTVEQGFNEPFNFETGRDFPDPSATSLYVSGAEGELLQKEKLAREFDMRSHWSQRVHGRLKIDPTGKLVLEGDPVWSDIDISIRGP